MLLHSTNRLTCCSSAPGLKNEVLKNRLKLSRLMASSILFSTNLRELLTNGSLGAEPSMNLLQDYLNSNIIFCHKESLQYNCWDSFLSYLSLIAEVVLIHV